MRVIVFTSDRYLSLLPDFAYLFNKHWGKDQSVDILGFAPPNFDLPPNFNFVSAGAQSDFPPKSFCEPFLPVLEKFEDDVFTVMLDDMFLIAPVDHDLVTAANEHLKNATASKVDLFLGADYQFAAATHFDEKFNVFSQDMDYRTTAAQMMIRKDYYLKYFDRDTIWQFEVENTPRSKNDGHNLLVSKHRPIAPWINMIVKGGWNGKHFMQMLWSKTGRKFGWNEFQKLDDEEYEIFMKYKNWSPG